MKENYRTVIKSFLWHLIHNLVAHPLLCLPQSWQWTDKFHDWTADKAYKYEIDILDPPFFIDNSSNKSNMLH